MCYDKIIKSASVFLRQMIREKSRLMRQNYNAEKIIYDKMIREMSGCDKMIKCKKPFETKL